MGHVDHSGPPDGVLGNTSPRGRGAGGKERHFLCGPKPERPEPSSWPVGVGGRKVSSGEAWSRLCGAGGPEGAGEEASGRQPPPCAVRAGVRPSSAVSLRVAAISCPQVPLLISLVLSRQSLGPVSGSDLADPLSCYCYHLHQKF